MCMYVYKKEDPTEGREKNNHHQQTPADWLVWWTHEPFNGPPHPTRAIVRGTPLPTRRNTLHTALIQTRIADKHTHTHVGEKNETSTPLSCSSETRLVLRYSPLPPKNCVFSTFLSLSRSLIHLSTSSLVIGLHRILMCLFTSQSLFGEPPLLHLSSVATDLLHPIRCAVVVWLRMLAHRYGTHTHHLWFGFFFFLFFVPLATVDQVLDRFRWLETRLRQRHLTKISATLDDRETAGRYRLR